jgi:tetratricopeptide (TPR) repeat protein
MRQLISWQLSILLLARMAAGAQVDNSNQSSQSPDNPPDSTTPAGAGATANRAKAYFVQGDKQRALEDFNTAVKIAPKYAKPYYYRGVFYATQTDLDAALRDFDSLNSKLVPALRQRAIIHLTQNNPSGALADFSEAVRLQPKSAALWSDRGHLRILIRDYDGALKDEAEAIRLDPKLARAYFLRGAAFGDLGDSANAVSDIRTAVDMDPSLDHYVSTQGKTASIALPPL